MKKGRRKKRNIERIRHRRKKSSKKIGIKKTRESSLIFYKLY